MSSAAKNRKRRIERGDAVLVEWIDSTHKPGWFPGPESVSATGDCRTLGFILQADADFVVVAQNAAVESGMYGDAMKIPRRTVTRIRRVRCARR